MSSRKLVCVVVLATFATSSGCSWLFQDRLRGGVAAYDGRSEPHCSTGKGWPGLDTVFTVLGALSIVAGVTAGAEVDDETKTSWIVGGITDVLVFGGSAMTGYKWAGECREAYDAWNETPTMTAAANEQQRVQLATQFAANPRNDPDRAAAFWCGRGHRCTAEETTCPGTCQPQETAWCAITDRGFVCGQSRNTCFANIAQMGLRPKGECVERRAALWAGPPAAKAETPAQAATPAPPAPPRGHFCSTSASQPTASFCARQKTDCETARDAAIAAIADLGACTLTETASCFEAEGRERCYPSAEACAARSNGAPCAERN